MISFLPKVIAFAQRQPALLDRALEEFFGKVPPPDKEKDTALALFHEWLIFDYLQPSGLSFISEYYLTNPDKLSESKLAQFKTILESQKYGGFQILSRESNPHWWHLEHLFLGKKYRVYDPINTELPNKGTLIMRIGIVNHCYSFIGFVPLYVPSSYTAKAGADFKGRNLYQSPKEAWAILAKHDLPPPPKVSRKAVRQKQKQLKKQYQKLAAEQNLPISLAELTALINNESGGPPMDFWQDLIKKGLPDEVFKKQWQLFEDLWNYFPHRILNNQSPVELYNELKK